MPSNKNIWISREMLDSKAFLSIKTKTAYIVLLVFYTKRQMAKVGRRGRRHWIIQNNGEIEFTYREAQKRCGISATTFTRAIDELRDKGFIDIAATGMGVHKVKTLYSISDRWKHFGTPEYEEPEPRPRRPINGGFQRGNQLGRNCRINITVAVEHSSTLDS